MAARGRFKPENPGKYIGNSSQVLFRSSWEIRFMTFCDRNPSVLKWASEEVAIPYIKPTDNKRHLYYPDFLMIVKDKDNVIRKYIIEIKPLKETMITARSSVYDKLAVAVNTAKWEAAQAFCDKNGFIFKVMTEADMFAGGVPAKKRRAKK